MKSFSVIQPKISSTHSVYPSIRSIALLVFFFGITNLVFGQINFSTYSYCSSPQQFTGSITYYNAGTNPVFGCSVAAQAIAQQYCAVGANDFASSAACGACLQITYPTSGKTTVVQVADQCAGCDGVGAHGVDLSPTAMSQIDTNYVADGRISCNWIMIQCPVSILNNNSASGGNITYAFKDGEYSGIFFMDTLFPITSVTANGTALTREVDNRWQAAAAWGAGTMTFAITDARGNVVSTNINLIDGSGACAGSFTPCYSAVTNGTAYGATGMQHLACGQSAPTPTFTKTNTPTFTKTNTPVPPTNTFFTSTKTNTPTITYTFTNTKTFTPVPPTNTLTFTATKTNSPTNTNTNTPVPPTNTFTSTKTNTPTNTSTNTATKTNTPTNTNTNTPIPPTNTSTATKTDTSTNTPVPSTSTFTKTNTPTNTNTNTPMPLTNTFTATKTNTPSNTSTNTPVPPTNTFTATKTNTPTMTNTNSPVPPTSTFTSTSTRTFTNTNTPAAPTNTFTTTNTRTFTYTSTPIPPTNTFTSTNTRTNTFTPTNTSTPMPPTNTFTATNTRTFTSTNTPAPPTNTQTNTNTPAPPTNSFTPTKTNSPTNTSTPVPPTNTFTSTDTRTSTFTPTNTYTPVPPTATFTGTLSPTSTFTLTNTPMPPTNTSTFTPTKTNSPTDTSTNTPVPPTFTFTSTKTNSPTNTPTSTNTPTITNTPVFSYTFTNTFTPSPTFTHTNTSTLTATPTATFTATQPVVQIVAGPGSPANNTVGAGSSNVPVLQVKASNQSGETVQLTGIDLNAFGTGANSTGILTLTIWKDGDGLGIVDGSTTALATVTAPYASGTNILVSFSDSIAAGGSTDYLVTYSFSSSAQAGTYGVNIPNGGISGQGTVSGKSLNVTGGQVNGAVLTVAASTATSTFTPTPTGTSTSTPVATKTNTGTPTKTSTAQPKGSPTPIIYPNPSQGGPVQVYIPGQGIGDVKVDIFTTAFRKVQEATFSNIPLGVMGSGVTIAMTDKSGNSLASGVYYVVITVTPVSGGATYERLVGKLLLLR